MRIIRRCVWKVKCMHNIINEIDYLDKLNLQKHHLRKTNHSFHYIPFYPLMQNFFVLLILLFSFVYINFKHLQLIIYFPQFVKLLRVSIFPDFLLYWERKVHHKEVLITSGWEDNPRQEQYYFCRGKQTFEGVLHDMLTPNKSTCSSFFI